MNVTILGAGAWGTALGHVLHQGNHAITLWGHNPEHLAACAATRCNDRYLPGVPIPEAWTLEPRFERAIEASSCIVVAVPSKAYREVTDALSHYRGVLVSVTKGIESDTGLTMCGVLQTIAPDARIVALSGPTLAMEVARGTPSAIVAASPDSAAATTVQHLFHQPAFRVYRSVDRLGVELGGALKNVVAIAAGVGDGMGFGDNAKAALVTRGIVEIRRLGVACGALPETFAGLSGLGDLTVTCFSKLSRNRRFGAQLGCGEPVSEIVANSVSVAEGYPTARSAWHLARKLGIDTPIIDEVHAMLYEGKSVRNALQDLIRRESKVED